MVYSNNNPLTYVFTPAKLSAAAWCADGLQARLPLMSQLSSIPRNLMWGQVLCPECSSIGKNHKDTLQREY